MAAPVTGGVRSGGGGVQIVFQPPLEFIARQAGSFGRRLRNLEPLWDRFSHVLPDIFRQHFESHGEGAWPPLKAETLIEKSRKGYPPDPLIATGDMFNSLLSPGSGVDKGPMSMSWGTLADYAQYHQEGTTKMPMRQVIPDPFPAEYRRKLEVEMVKWIDIEAARAFSRAA
jgi:phage gpG-like protein